MHATISAASSAMPAHALAEALDKARKRVTFEEIALHGIILALEANGKPVDQDHVRPYLQALREAKDTETRLLASVPATESPAANKAATPAEQPVKHRACDSRCVKAKTPARTCSCACGGANHGKGAASAAPSPEADTQGELPIVADVKTYAWSFEGLQAFAKRHRRNRLTIALCDYRGRAEGKLDGPEITGAWLEHNLKHSFSGQYIPEGHISHLTAYAVAA